MAVDSRRISFTNQAGDKLAARLDMPAGEPKATALFAHCFTCSKDIFAASRISQGLAELGFAVLRFDFTGLGASEGEFANTNFSSNVGDLVAAADFTRAESAAPKILIGHSLGGAAVLAAAAQIPEAVAVATIGAPFDPGHIAHLFQSAQPDLESRGEADVLIGGRSFKVKQQFLDDIAAHNATSYLGSLKKALLVFHAPRDAVVGIENAGEIFKAAKHPKSFISLDDADHLLSRRADAVYVANVLAAWANRYLPAAELAEGRPAVAPDEVVVVEAGAGKFTQIVRTGRHELLADEPASFGGDDAGPDPYDYLLAGLGACTSMTVRLYAERKGWPLQRTVVRLQHRKIHAEDCADCETKSGKLDEIERRLSFEGDLDQAQRARLLDIADKCPVHQTLTHEVKIRSALSDSRAAYDPMQRRHRLRSAGEAQISPKPGRLRHSQLCGRRTLAGVGWLPGDRPVSARLWHDALSLERSRPERPAVGARRRRHRPDGCSQDREGDHRRRCKEAFEALHPDIQINWVRDSTGMATAKLLAEKDNPQADVVQGLAASSLLLMKGEGMIESHAPKGVERLDPRFVDQSDPPAWVGLDVWAASVGVSTVELEQAGLAMPTSWEDLTRPDCPVLALMISSTNALVRIGHGLVVDRMIRAQRWRRR